MFSFITPDQEKMDLIGDGMGLGSCINMSYIVISEEGFQNLEANNKANEPRRDVLIILREPH